MIVLGKRAPAGVADFGAPGRASKASHSGVLAPPQHAGTIDSIQYLRAIAAWLVVVFHLTSSLGFEFGWGDSFAIGAIGVDIFFVISGYIMAMIAARSGSFSPVEFMLRRAARIAPLYWSMTFVICAVCLLYPSLINNPDITLGRMFFSLFFLPDFVSGATHPALITGWTLHYEFFFYALVAFSIWLTEDRTLRVTALMLCICVAAGAMIDGNRIFVFYTQPIILEFVFGILIWNYGARLTALRYFRIIWLLALPPIFLALAVSDIYTDEIRFLIWGLPAAFFVLGAIPFFTAQLPWLARLGDWSFSTYLLHIYVIQLFVKLVAARAVGSPLLLAVESMLVLLLIALISAAQFSWFERPAARFLNRRLDAIRSTRTRIA